MRRYLGVVAIVASVVALSLAAVPGGASPRGAGRAAHGQARSVDRALIRAKLRMGGASRARTGPFLPSAIECTAKATGANTNLDCDDPVAPNNEPDVIVDPTDPKHMIASSNDYDSNGDEFYTTFNGGKTWTTGDMSMESASHIGSDPATAIDPKHGTAIHSSLNFLINDNGEAYNGDVVISVSKDGGKHWAKPVVVYEGHGRDLGPTQVFNDKEWVTTDTNPSSPYYGRTYLTWSRFLAHDGNYFESPIWSAYSDDGGWTWSQAQEISGSSPTCTYQTDGPTNQCDEDQFSVPTTDPAGNVYVSFENSQHEAAWEPGDTFENQYMVVKSTDGGVTWQKPVSIVDMEDGTADLSTNVDGRQTVTGFQVRLSSIGNIVAAKDGKLYQSFADNRNGRHDVANPRTNLDVFVCVSKDGGAHWSGPVLVDASKTDQWFPWVDVNEKTGRIGVLYNDRGTGGNRVAYGITLAQGLPNSGFSYGTENTKWSFPKLSAFFRAGAKPCPKCATFNGDYIRLDYGSDGSANAVWTDMRRWLPLGGQDSGYGENIFFRRS